MTMMLPPTTTITTTTSSPAAAVVAHSLSLSSLPTSFAPRTPEKATTATTAAASPAVVTPPPPPLAGHPPRTALLTQQMPAISATTGGGVVAAMANGSSNNNENYNFTAATAKRRNRIIHGTTSAPNKAAAAAAAPAGLKLGPNLPPAPPKYQPTRPIFPVQHKIHAPTASSFYPPASLHATTTIPHHQQEQQQLPQRPPPPLPETTLSSSLHIIVTLERSSATAPWGLALRYHHHQNNNTGRFYLGPHIHNGTKSSCAAAVVRGFWMVPSPSRSSCGQEDDDHDHGTVTTTTTAQLPHLIHTLLRSVPVATALSTTMYPVHDILQPGDQIVAVGGRSITDFPTLHQLTNYIRHSLPQTMVQWVLWRRQRQRPPPPQRCHPSPPRAITTTTTTPSRLPTNPFSVLIKIPPWTAATATANNANAILPNHFRPMAVAPVPPPFLLHRQPMVPAVVVPKKKLLLCTPKPPPIILATPHYYNPLFRDPATGEMIRYQDDDDDKDEAVVWYSAGGGDPDGGGSAALFVQPVENFAMWLTQRKRTWRALRPHRPPPPPSPDHRNNKRRCHDYGCAAASCSEEEFHAEVLQWEDATISRDFWSPQGFDSLQSWLMARTQQWRSRYSWNQTKRRRLTRDCFADLQEETETMTMSHHHHHHHHRESSSAVVDISHDFDEWLRVRKNQWLVQRRKRHKRRQQQQQQQGCVEVSQQQLQPPLQMHRDHHHRPTAVVGVTSSPSSSSPSCCSKKPPPPPSLLPPPLLLAAQHAPKKEIQMIDDLIEEEEQRQKARRLARGPMDISFLFDSTIKDIPDDVVCKIFGCLTPAERLRLLCVNRATRQQLMSRDNLWRLLCPTRWKLPRRPRKPYCMIYRHNLRLEMEASRKQWDDLLTKAAKFLLSGDLLGTLEKLVNDAEQQFEFHINYVSGVVCERNSLLNLAVIHQRHRVVRWLVETKGADIESADRGNFTPLLNAAWAGDRYLVRYLMQRGANRATVGRFHYTKGVAPAGFAGRTAQGWAQEKGHTACARLLALGL